MNESNENIIVQKSYAFGLSIVQLYKTLVEQKEYVLSKQMLRSGTSIGANIHESIASESKNDFVHKLSIVVKEAKETPYWLRLLKDSGFVTIDDYERLNDLCDELIRILNSIILTTKQRYFSNS